MATIVLVHGWGHDASLWDAVRDALDPALPVETVNLGYFGAEHLPKVGAGNMAIAVGHSLGALWWLTQRDIPWSRLLCINGFPRFTEDGDFAPAVPPRILARMRAQFAREPSRILAEFHSRCGMSCPRSTPDTARLAAGLDWLAEWDGRDCLGARRADIFALAGAADPIVPAAMSQRAFSGLPEGHLDVVAAPGHALPLTHPDRCARWIERLAA